MLYFFIRSLENAFDPSRIAAFFFGPNVRIPASSRTSTRPPTSGSSIPTIQRSIAFSFAKSLNLSNSIAPIGTHCAYSAIPAFPGAQKILSALGLFATLAAIACSLPPLPTINTFIVFASLFGNNCTMSFYFNLSVCDQIDCMWKDLPFSLFHHSALKYFRSISILNFYSLL